MAEPERRVNQISIKGVMKSIGDTLLQMRMVGVTH